jgi:hypothetical protein
MGGVELELHHSVSEPVQIYELRVVDCFVYNLFHAGFLLAYFFFTEDGGEIFVRNVSVDFSTDYTAFRQI